jgi:hypothetical protein
MIRSEELFSVALHFLIVIDETIFKHSSAKDEIIILMKFRSYMLKFFSSGWNDKIYFGVLYSLFTYGGLLRRY